MKMVVGGGGGDGENCLLREVRSLRLVKQKH